MREDSDNMFWLLDYIIYQFYLETLPRSKLFFCLRLPIAFKNSRKPKLFGKGE